MPRWTFDRCGGHLALDFANTVSDRGSEHPIERLPAFPDLVEFARQTGLVSAGVAGQIETRALRHPDEAQATWRGAIALRDAFYDLFAALAAKRRPPVAALAVVNSHLDRLRLDEELAWRWRPGPARLDEPLGRIFQAGVELLTSDARSRIRLCAADGCGWVFLDTSKNHSRRWCDMAQCGNRAKARRFQARRTTGG